MSILKENQKKGLPNKSYFYTKFENWEKYDNNEFHFTNVAGDGNWWYRCVSLQLFGSEDDYNIIRQNVFHYLDKNRTNYSDYNFEYNGNILSNNEYIDTIKDDGEWMGELEITAISIIYNINILVFKITDNDEIYLINKYGDFNNRNRILVALWFINNNHYIVVYEKQNINTEIFNNNISENKTNINLDISINSKELNFLYANETNKTNKLGNIKNFIINRIKNGINIYSEHINTIKNHKIRHNKKQNFKRVCKGYDYDFKINRLIKKIKISNKSNTIQFKNYIVAYELEKII